MTKLSLFFTTLIITLTLTTCDDQVTCTMCNECENPCQPPPSPPSQPPPTPSPPPPQSTTPSVPNLPYYSPPPPASGGGGGDGGYGYPTPPPPNPILPYFPFYYYNPPPPQIAGQVRVLHVLSRYQFADIFTKGLPSALFEEFRTGLSV
ncbi:hypothetical protein Tco_0750744 [Tanacetum coccineum]|uniref:Uncharacterized protein n=1 Tax=Tanacetum coccineum TaxID=301880 RepID=A0ABQ4Z5S1_9ASTR